MKIITKAKNGSTTNPVYVYWSFLGFCGFKPIKNKFLFFNGTVFHLFGFRWVKVITVNDPREVI